jgi:hypothetical protein
MSNCVAVFFILVKIKLEGINKRYECLEAHLQVLK